ncbi:MAG: response regulator [Chloroflexota bacterium]
MSDLVPVLEANRTVLVVEDHAPTAEVLRGHLEGSGFRVLVAADGTAGMAMARSGGVDLITLDVLMEPVDGWSLFRMLRAERGTSHIPVIFISVVETRPPGTLADGYVTKPFRRRRLMEVVERALEARQR